MGHPYRAVGWNRQKRLIDSALALGVLAFLILFVGLGLARFPHASPETLALRGLGAAAFVLLHVILSIGPLARLDARFLPLLYNRRHLGVTMFLLALAHALFAVAYYHGLGNVHPLVSVLSANPRLDSLSQFPFELLGAAALAVLFVMAATSHDFWLHNLGAPTWKALHMAVYPAYALIVLHVALGTLQAERDAWLAAGVGLGLVWIVGLHLAAARRERAGDAEPRSRTLDDGFVEVCAVSDIPEGRARVVSLSGERVAVFRNAGSLSALSNACQHQNGPLGEGRIVDGLVVCPWHGYQYVPRCGRSPEPFTERVPTFRVRVRDGMVQVHPTPLPAGTDVEPAPAGEDGP